MLELATYEGRKWVKGSITLALLFTALAGMYTGTFSSTIEGYLASQFYTVGWILLADLYFGYTRVGLIANDVDRGRMDVLIFLPISRSRLVVEKFASVLVAINVVVPVVVFVASRAIEYSIAALDVVMMHLLLIPYLLCCAAIGLLFSVVMDLASIAQRSVLGVLFGLFLFESVAAGTDFGWAGNIVPMHYLDPTAILMNGEYDIVAAGILLVATIALISASLVWFARKDVA